MRSRFEVSHYLIALACCAVVACATTPSQRAAAVVDSDAKGVEQCKFVGQIAGSSGVGGLAASTGMANAKTEAREKAASLGATHVVWDSIDGGWSPSASGKAYRCGQ